MPRSRAGALINHRRHFGLEAIPAVLVPPAVFGGAGGDTVGIQMLDDGRLPEQDHLHALSAAILKV